MSTPSSSQRGPASWRSIVGLLVVMVLAWAGTQAVSHWQTRDSTRLVRELAKEGDIVMFTTDTCPYCAQAREWLSKHQVPWQECNVDQDAHCRAVFQAQGAPGVPLMNVRGQWRLGFDPLWLGETLKQAPSGV